MRHAHPSDGLWRGTSLYTPVRTIRVIERPKEAAEAEDAARRAGRLQGRSVPFGFGVRKPRCRWDYATGAWVRA